jgi:hypothetical protein
MMRLGLITLVAAGCSFHASYDGTHYQCGAGDTCPSGQSCVAGLCVESSGGPDAPFGTPDAPPGTPDASPDAAMAQANCSTLELLRDDFSADRYGTIWDQWSDNPSGGVLATVAGGQLVITIPSNGADQGAGYSSNFYYDLRGSQAAVTVNMVADTDTILEVRDTKNGKLQLVDEGGTLFAAAFNVPGAGDLASATYDPVAHKHWRIREDAGVVYWETSPNGSTWNELFHEADPLTRPDYVIVELSADGNGASVAMFDDLNTGLATTDAFCAGSSLVDDFSSGIFNPVWSSWHDPSSTISETGGQAVASIPAQTDAYAGFDSKRLYDLRESAIYVDSKGTSSAANFTNFFQIVEPGDGSTMIEMARQAGSLICQFFVTGVNSGNPVATKTVAYDGTATRYWRVRLSGTTIHWETSPDASAWTEQFSASTTADRWHTVHVNLGAGYYGTAAAATTAAWSGIDTP